MNNADIIARVSAMEECFDRVRSAFDAAPDSVFSDVELQRMYRELVDYMDDGMWQKDYCCDENGGLPKDMKRGVLSQDGLYDLLADIDKYRRNRNL